MGSLRYHDASDSRHFTRGAPFGSCQESGNVSSVPVPPTSRTQLLACSLLLLHLRRAIVQPAKPHGSIRWRRCSEVSRRLLDKKFNLAQCLTWGN
jgi:hypothetical protein